MLMVINELREQVFERLIKTCLKDSRSVTFLIFEDILLDKGNVSYSVVFFFLRLPERGKY